MKSPPTDPQWVGTATRYQVCAGESDKGWETAANFLQNRDALMTKVSGACPSLLSTADDCGEARKTEAIRKAFALCDGGRRLLFQLCALVRKFRESQVAALEVRE
jgi:hypothetical protein